MLSQLHLTRDGVHGIRPNRARRRSERHVGVSEAGHAKVQGTALVEKAPLPLRMVMITSLMKELASRLEKFMKQTPEGVNYRQSPPSGTKLPGPKTRNS